MIALDPGHGGRDAGAVGPGGLTEAEVAYRVAQELQSLHPDSFLTRGETETMELPKRVALAEEKGAKAYVSIHCNGAGNPAAQGIEVFYHHGSERGQRLAAAFYLALREAFPNEPGRGVRADTALYASGLYVLRKTSMPAALVELGFITNKDTEEAMRSPTWAKLAASALKAGLDAYEKVTP